MSGPVLLYGGRRHSIDCICEAAWICVKTNNTNALKPSYTKYFVFAGWGLWKGTCVKSKGLLLISVIHGRQRLAWRTKCSQSHTQVHAWPCIQR